MRVLHGLTHLGMVPVTGGPADLCKAWMSDTEFAVPHISVMYTFTLLPQTFTGSQTKVLREWFCVGSPRKEQVLNSAPTQHRSEPGGVCADEGIPQISGSLVAGVRATRILRGTPWRLEGCLGVFQPIHLHWLHLGRK